MEIGLTPRFPDEETEAQKGGGPWLVSFPRNW